MDRRQGMPTTMMTTMVLGVGSCWTWIWPFPTTCNSLHQPLNMLTILPVLRTHARTPASPTPHLILFSLSFPFPDFCMFITCFHFKTSTHCPVLFLFFDLTPALASRKSNIAAGLLPTPTPCTFHFPHFYSPIVVYLSCNCVRTII